MVPRMSGSWLESSYRAGGSEYIRLDLERPWPLDSVTLGA